MKKIYPPEKITLKVCPWIELHRKRESGSSLKIGEFKYVILELQFERWKFPQPSVRFFLEFSKQFMDIVVVVNEVVCEDCMEEIQKMLDMEIMEAGCIPPEEEQ